jgi:hypothetical protein
MKIYCCGCKKEVKSRLTDGKEIYPNRPDLYSLPFWKCDTCNNYVGCHHKTKNRTKPLGCIPTKEIKNARQHIHAILDPIWKNGHMKRGEIYKIISQKIGYQFHTADIKSVEDARKINKVIIEIKKTRG